MEHVKGKIVLENGREDFLGKLPSTKPSLRDLTGYPTPLHDALREDALKQGLLITWMGPICPTCDKRYLGYHSCSPSDLRGRAAQLRKQADNLEAQASERDSMTKDT